VPKTSVEK
jgi:tRNA 2-selenouridine synthase SelU